MKALKWLGTAALAFLTLSVAFYMPYNNDSIFTKRISNDNLEDYESLRHYLDGGTLSEAFTEAEKNHMKDVKGILYNLEVLAYIFTAVLAAATIIFYHREEYEKMKEATYNAGMAVLGFLILIGAIAAINFGFFWREIFHPVLFPQGGWLFPADSTLITLFPLESFKEFTYRFLANSLLLSAGLVSWKKFTSRSRPGPR